MAPLEEGSMAILTSPFASVSAYIPLCVLHGPHVYT